MKKKKKLNLVVSLVLFVFLILLATNALAGIIITLLSYYNLVTPFGRHSFLLTTIILLISSIVIGTALTALVSKRPLRPVRMIINATREIADGNFNVRIVPSGPREMQELSESFNTMAKKLGSTETLSNDFISNVSHEFKTPVASIKGFAKLLKKDSLSDETRKEYLDIIIAESERLSQLSGNILLLSKLEKREKTEEVTTFPLDEQIRRCVLLLEPQFRRKDITLNVDLEAVQFKGNEELLYHVWVNLLGNALKFTHYGDQISIVLHKKNDMVVVKISDTGIGMNEEVSQHLFDKFYQGDKSHSTEGNGLGLSLVARIVELHGGTIKVTSELEKGSSFTVML